MQSLFPFYVGGVAVALGWLWLRKHFAGGVCRCSTRLDGKTVIITGANSGIGKQTALDLAKRGARVVMACRDKRRAEAAAAEVRAASGSHHVSVRLLDLANLASVRRFAASVLDEFPHIHVLINNAGVMRAGKLKYTDDGFESMMGVNHLGHFLLTNLLLDRMKASQPARIINVASVAHKYKGNYLDLEDLMFERRVPGARHLVDVYSQSKLANIVFTRELSRRLEGSTVTANCLHPGVIATELAENGIFQNLPRWQGLLVRWARSAAYWAGLVKTPRQGAQTQIHLAVSPALARTSGHYFSDCEIEELVVLDALDDQKAKKFWEISEKLVGLKN